MDNKETQKLEYKLFSATSKIFEMYVKYYKKNPKLMDVYSGA